MNCSTKVEVQSTTGLVIMLVIQTCLNIALFQLTNDLLCSSAPEFDVSEIESLFSAAVPKPANKSGDRRKSAGSKPEKVTLVSLL